MFGAMATPRTTRTNVLLALTVIGFVVPNVMVGIYIADEGLDLGTYFSLWFDSTPSTQLVLDLAIVCAAFFTFAAFDGPRTGVRRWWWCIPATLLVGACFGVPLYLYMRERVIEGTATA
jgi:hypothetical protein